MYKTQLYVIVVSYRIVLKYFGAKLGYAFSYLR